MERPALPAEVIDQIIHHYMNLYLEDLQTPASTSCNALRNFINAFPRHKRALAQQIRHYITSLETQKPDAEKLLEDHWPAGRHPECKPALAIMVRHLQAELLLKAVEGGLELVRLRNGDWGVKRAWKVESYREELLDVVEGSDED